MAVKLEHRERFLRSLDHKEIDRLPVFFRPNPDFQAALYQRYGFGDARGAAVYFGSDAIQIPPPSSSQHLPNLKQAESVEDILRAAWPDLSGFDFRPGVQQSREAYDAGWAVYGGVWASLFTISRGLLGEEKYLTAIALEPDFVAALIGRLVDFFLQVNKAYLDLAAPYTDVYYFGSDFGTQLSMFISPEMFRRFYKPHLKRLADQAKSYCLKVMYHTCGAVAPIIPDLIDCGIDILDPVQTSAQGMAPDRLVQFKGKIAFHGGIATQNTLPFGSPDQVREETLRLIETLGPFGLIACPDQDLIGEVPMENVEMLYRTVREYPIASRGTNSLA